MGQFATELSCRTDTDAMRLARGTLGRATTRQTGASTAQRNAILNQTVELEVIPRLILARRARAAAMQSPMPHPPMPHAKVSAAQVAQLAAITLAPDGPGTSGFVTAMRDQGFAAEQLYLDLLAPAALRLGSLWDDDLCDFTEVTIGLWRLQHAMLELRPTFLIASLPAIDRRALLVPLPGEQHTFGLSMVFDFFRRAGWNAWTGPIATASDLADMVSSQWVDMVGFSLACDERLETARDEIRAVRRASRNPGMAVMVGGPPFVMDPYLAAAIGADGTARDGLQAVAEADALVLRQMERR
jgi:methanogenic corrinoid protein MtbC1